MDAPVFNKKVITVVLAAGKSSRLRRPKQLLPFLGRTLIRYVVQVALFSQCWKVVVVLGAFQERIKSQLKYFDVETVRNRFWHRGMGASLKEGVRFVMAKYENKFDAFLFVVCDQPRLNETHINELIATYESSGAPIVASRFADTFGVPALVDRKFADELLAIEDNSGAKAFLETHVNEIAFVDFPGGDIDVDTPEDVLQLSKTDWRSLNDVAALR